MEVVYGSQLEFPQRTGIHVLRRHPAVARVGYSLETPPRDSHEALRAAGLNWHVRKEPLFVITSSGNIRVTQKCAILREDNQEILGVVSEEYQPLQNEEAFRFFDGIIDLGAAEYETAGALGKGERIWILAKMKQPPMLIAGFDEVQKYLLLVNTHDGSSSVHIRFTPVRVVCQNTLTMALREGWRVQSIVHRRGLHRRLQEARELVGSIVHTYRDIERNFNLMASVKVDQRRLQEYIEAVFPLPNTTHEQDSSGTQERVISLRNQALYLFTYGTGNTQPPIKGTLWAAYNAVTQMIDCGLHRRRQWSGVDRLSDACFGEGSTIKARAYREAVARLKAWG